MTKEELKLLAKWTAQLWDVYLKFSQTVMNQWDFDALMDEIRKIWEESGQNDLVFDLGMGFANDIERRWSDGTE